MSHTLLERDELIVAADEARLRKRRRHLTSRVIGVLGSLGLIAVAVFCTVGFVNSWWVEKGIPASSDQQARDGSSVFTQAGVDYFTKQGVLRVTMGADRPGAGALGLPASGTKHVDLLVPVTVEVTASGTIDMDLVGSLDVVTSGGRISAIGLPTDGDYAGLIRQVDDLAPQFGWSGSDVSRFTAQLQASRAAHDFGAYSATIGPAEHDGMLISATLSADATSGPTLVVTFRPHE
jgi:hypothetical protein